MRNPDRSGAQGDSMRARRRVGQTFLVWLIPFLVAAFTLAGALIAFLQYRSLSMALNHKASRTASLVSVLLAKPVWDLDSAQIQQSLDALTLDPELTAVTVASRETNLVLRKNPQNIRAGLLVRQVVIAQPGAPGNGIGTCTLYLTRELMMSRIRESILALAAVMILALATVLFLNNLIQRQLVTRPIEVLLEEIGQHSANASFQPVTVRTEDEIGHLAGVFNSLLGKLGDQARRLQEIKLAKAIQTLLLPKDPVIPGYAIVASQVPVADVGGDYYDVISVAGRHWIVVGDVSGHGLTAGLVMMMVQTAIHTIVLSHPDISSANLLASINRAIHQNIQLMDEKIHMTIVVLACQQDGAFTFSGLHEDILLRRAGTGTVERIQSNGMWIGLEAEISGLLPVETLNMAPGDCMVLYTDGLTEARGKDGGFFGDDRLASLLEMLGDRSAGEVHQGLWAALEGYEKKDDVTILVIKRNP